MKRLCLYILLFLLIILVIYAAWNYFTIRSDYRQGRESYASLEQYISITPPPQSHGDIAPTQQVPSTESTYTSDADTANSAPPISVDFDSLRQINPDIVGWIYIPDTNINYPIVKGQDNDTYLYRLFDGTYNESGSIFLDTKNTSDFTDRNSILYGHYMKDGSMFHDLRNYRDPSYYESHPTGILITPEGWYEIAFFSGYISDTLSHSWDIRFSTEGYSQWLRDITAKSLFSSNIQATDDDRILTLSTCSYEFAEARFILHGKIIEHSPHN